MSTHRVRVAITYPDKSGDLSLKSDAVFGDLKKETEGFLKLSLSAYEWCFVPFAGDVVSLKGKPNDYKLELKDNLTFIAIAPASIKPARERPADKPGDEKTDDRFKGLNAENIFAKLATAKDGSNKKLAFEYLDLYSSEVLKGKSFLRLPQKNVIEIIKRDTLSAQELEIFDAVIAWGNHQLKVKEEKSTPDDLKSVVAELIPYVRFTLLATEEVAAKVTPTGVLSGIQTLELFTYLAQKDSGTATPGSSLSVFNAKLRTGSGRYGPPGKKMKPDGFTISSIQGPWCYGSYDNCHASSVVAQDHYQRVLGYFNGSSFESYKTGEDEYNLPRGSEPNGIYSYPSASNQAIEFKFTKGPAWIRQFRFLSTRLESGVTVAVFSRKNPSESWGENKSGSNSLPVLSNGGGLKQWAEVNFPKALHASEFRIEVRGGQCAIHVVQFVNGP